MKRLLAAGLFALALGACAPAPSETQVPVQNETPRPLRVRVVDRGPDGGLRRRVVELPAGARFSLDLRFGAPLDERGARLEVRTAEGEGFHARYVTPSAARALGRNGAALAFTAADLGIVQPAPAVSERVNLAAGKPAIADEVDPPAPPDHAVDADPKSYWRGLMPPPHVTGSWAVDLGRPATIERVELAVECVRCGPARVRLTFLRDPVPPAAFAMPGAQQSASILGLVDGMSGSVVGTLDVAGAVENGSTLAAAPAHPLVGVRVVVASLIEAPENIGFYDVRIEGQWDTEAR